MQLPQYSTLGTSQQELQMPQPTTVVCRSQEDMFSRDQKRISLNINISRYPLSGGRVISIFVFFLCAYCSFSFLMVITRDQKRISLRYPRSGGRVISICFFPMCLLLFQFSYGYYLQASFKTRHASYKFGFAIC